METIGTPPELSFSEEECDSDAGSVAHAQSLRSAVGLASDWETVDESYKGGSYQCTAFGVPMTPAELSVYGRVLMAQADASEYVESVSDDPTFSTAYLEGAELILASTDGRLGTDFKPSHGSIRMVQADYSAKELSDTADEIAQSIRDGSAEQAGLNITLVNVDPRTSLIEVGVASDVEKAKTYFGDRYGAIVAVRFEPVHESLQPYVCTQNDCLTAGGLVADHPQLTPGCTTGFVSRTRRADQSTWYRRMLVAGHCIEHSGGVANSNSWHNGSNTITWGPNKAEDSQWYECGFWTKCTENDLGLFGLGGAPAQNNWNSYYVGGSLVGITGRTTGSNQLVGTVVYRYGRTSGYDSGPILAKPAEWAASCFPYTCKWLYPIRADLPSDHGDSGSGIFAFIPQTGGRTAYGILFGGPTPGSSPTYYYAWDKQLNDETTETFIVQPCINAWCG
jgi:hypothetical protein